MIPSEPRVSIKLSDWETLFALCLGDGNYMDIRVCANSIDKQLKRSVPIELDHRGPDSRKHKAAILTLERAADVAGQTGAFPDAIPYRTAAALLIADQQFRHWDPFFGMLERNRRFVFVMIRYARERKSMEPVNSFRGTSMNVLREV